MSWQGRWCSAGAGPGPPLGDEGRPGAVGGVLPGLVRAAQLVTGAVGWVLAANMLAVTSDAGRTWTPITPPGVRAGVIRGVYFRDVRRGWVVSAWPATWGSWS